MNNYEKLAAFYLGRAVGGDGEPVPEPLLYDAKDLTTHAVCVGMTGSGKTGLCLSLLEEAAIDGIPVIAIDPKGDLGNLLLTFPKLRAADFQPWIDEGEALRKGMDVPAYAARTAKLWKDGLASWDQQGERIQRLKDAADFAIYTPGSETGLPLTILRSFAAPPDAVLEDGEAMRDRVQAATSGILALLGHTADPLRSREHILVSNILDRSWRAGTDLTIPALIQAIAAPPFDKLGVFDLETFYPQGDRMALAMELNNLLASPGFAPWMEGEPLDVQRLLYQANGKPRVSILSIAHLNDQERMFFVTLLLNEVISWMRSQPGTTSLRAILYMDEVFGYLPPTANPPSKVPLLTLLKQARAFGLGCVLATQNPVDLDYKALSNAGTWFLGRLQTERDKMRVLDGLEGATASAGAGFDRQAMETMISGLKSRQFLMNNVHDAAPVLFHTRWAMSYLRGPLTRTQIKELMQARKAAAPATAEAPAERRAPKAAATPAAPPAPRPTLPKGTRERFLPAEDEPGDGARLVYRPTLLGEARIHFASVRDDVDRWDEVRVFAPLDEEGELDPWADEEPLPETIEDLERKPEGEGSFDDVPRQAMTATGQKRLQSRLKTHLYRTRATSIWKCKKLKEASSPGESEADFRIRLSQKAREARDLAIEKLRKKYAPKLARMEERIRKAEQRVEREQAQYKQQKVSTAVSLGATLLGALFGRKAASVGTVGRAGSTVRGMGRAARERGDVARARETLESLRPRLVELEAEFEDETARLQEAWDLDALELDEKPLRPRKSDTSIDQVTLVWCPWSVNEDGDAEPLFA